MEQQSAFESHSAKLLKYHVYMQKTAMRYAVPITIIFFIYQVIGDSCWQNLVQLIGFAVVSLCWFKGFKSTQAGKLDHGMILFSIPVILFEFLSMCVLEHVSETALLADIGIVIYCSLFGKRYLLFTGSATFFTFLGSELVKYLHLVEPKTFAPGERLIYLTVFTTIVLPLVVWILLRNHIMQKDLLEGMEALNEEQKTIISTADDINSVLEDVVHEIQEAIDSFASQTSEQAAAIGEIDMVMAQVRWIAKNTASSAADTTAVADKVRKESARGRNQLKSMEEGFFRVVDINDKAKHVFADLGNQVDSIEDVLTTNREIAAQIKILAVNAGIQAAKAGEFGTGFRVVATELKGMITRTDESLSHSRSLLEEIRRQAKESANAIQKSGDLLHGQLAELSSTSMLIEVLADAFVNASEHIDKIADSAREQQARLDEVGTGIGNIDFAANELKNSAGSLRESVEKIEQSQHALSTALSGSFRKSTTIKS